MLERFKAGYEHFLGLTPIPGVDSETDPATDDEHRAVLELLVATMFADGTVSDEELNEIDRYGADHRWDGPTFSFTQGLGSATAKVRDAREAGAIDALLADAAGRITSPEVRATVVAACRLVASADGTSYAGEAEWIGAVQATFGA